MKICANDESFNNTNHFFKTILYNGAVVTLESDGASKIIVIWKDMTQSKKTYIDDYRK